MKKLFTVLISLGLFFGCGTSKNQAMSPPVEESTANSSGNDTSNIENTTSENGIEEEQNKVVKRPVYQSSATILTDLVHTKLEVDFNWEKSQMNGVATLTCSPHFYATDSLILDAKAMEIKSVILEGETLKYQYNDAQFLRIKLDQEYTRDQEYTVVIDYIAKPEEKELSGSSAISSDKGLYFINPKGENENQMPHIWTQGETEASSVWFPTIDRPNQNTTQEIYMTVEDKYKTLSNGTLVSSTKNGDGTRTDYWKQDLPHVPYLFMMGVGEFSVVKDSYTRPDGTEMPVHYYVEPEWEEHAQAIFGETPAMIGFFADLLGVEYKWDKYHQIVVREYVSGAMENTGAVVFGDFVYKNKRALIDSDDHAIIAHELFHHWFGNLVTCESWSNLPLNEAFANYAQYLWDEHYNGRDHADYVAEKEADGYFQSSKQTGHHDMIWFDYEDKEDMFDAHSYNKGGRVLHMLRYYLGDDAFFEGLKKYLNDNAFQAVEIHHLRLAFEAVSGEDLNWFFNQWFLSSHHPKIDISQEVKEGEVKLTIQQTQDLEKAPLYKLPMKIGVYAGSKKTSHEIVLTQNKQIFTLPFSGELENIIVDEDRTILGVFNHEKPRTWYVHQYYNAPRYKDRAEGLTYGSRLQSPKGKQLILDALEDDFWYIRQLAISKLSKLGENKKEAVFTVLKKRATTDKNSKVRAAALSALADDYFNKEFVNETRSILKKAIEKDSSYLVVSNALNGLTKGNKQDIEYVLTTAKTLEKEQSSSLKAQIIGIYKKHGDASHIDFMSEAILSGNISGYDLMGSLMNYSGYLNQQEVKMRLNYFYVLTILSNSSNAYINMVFPMTIADLLQGTKSKIKNLEKEIEALEKASKTGEATILQGELTKEETYKDKLMELAKKVSTR